MSSRFKKRSVLQGTPADPLAAALYAVQTRIARGQIEEALGDLDALALTHGDDLVTSAKIGCLAADSQMKLGRYHEAATYYRNILASLNNDGGNRAWFRPALGEVRALLKSVQIDEAKTRADQLWLTASSKVETFLAALDAAGEDGLEISQQPTSLKDAATKLGNVFLQEGFPAEARTWFERALANASSGGTRARLTLARLSLAGDDAAAAKAWTEEALQNSNFSASSVPAWHLLISTRVRLGTPPHPETLFTEMLDSALPSIRERMVLSVARSLRSFGAAEWKDIAANWLTSPSHSDEVIGIELSKILLADGKLSTADPTHLALAAHRILRSDLVSPSEAVSMTKTIVSSELAAGLQPDTLNLADKVDRLFGGELKRDSIHAMALAAATQQAFPLARSLFDTLFQDPESSEERLGKARWALGSIENQIGNYQSAADLFLTLSASSALPPALKVQALRLWLQALQNGNLSVDEAELPQRINAVLDGIEDAGTLLDIGRQLSLISGPQLDALREQVYTIAESRAWTDILASDHPVTALSKLIHLTRRQYFDFAHTAAVVSQWHSLSTEKRAWLRSEANTWWEYLSLVFEALATEGHVTEAEELVANLINSDEVTAEGYVWLGTAYANWKIRNGGRPQEGLEHFNWIVNEQPTHRQASWGYYWKGLNAWKQGEPELAATYGQQIRTCFAGKPSYTWQWLLDAVGCLLISGMDAQIALTNFPNVHSLEFLQQSRQLALREMNKI